jgi:hypothetical protein
MKLNAQTYILPAYWASYLINGDDSGLSDSELNQCNDWLEKEGNPQIVDCGESYFSWHNDAQSVITRVGGDVCEYTALFHVQLR